MYYKFLAERAEYSSQHAGCYSKILAECATGITALLARAEAAEAANSQLNGTVTTLMESNRKLAEDLKAHMETDLAKAHEALSADWAKQKKRADEAEAQAEKAERERDALKAELDYYKYPRQHPIKRFGFSEKEE